MISAEKNLQQIIVEIKSFTGHSLVNDLENALGQYILYRQGLNEANINRELYLAITKSTFEQYLLFGYLDTFVRQVHGFMYLEVRNGRGRMDLIVLHNQTKYIVETKIWEGNKRYQAGKRQLAQYLKLEGMKEGYYVVFDHRREPEARQEEEIIEGLSIVSYIIPVVQEIPSENK